MPSTGKSKVLSVDEVEAEVERIGTMSRDYEAAHGAEDSLYEDVLKAIAKGCNQFHAQKLAKAALKTKKLSFPRYTA